MDASMQTRLMTPDNGFAAGATYSAAYLNQSGTSGYKDMTVFYGAQASVRQEPMYDSKGLPIASKPLPALLSGGRMMAGQSTGIAAGAITLNGVALGALTPAGSSLQASEVAAWINRAGATGVSAVASNEIRVPASQLKLNMPLSIKGTSIALPAGGFANVQALANAVQAQSATTGVQAAVSRDGELVLSNVTGQEGRDITIDATTYAGSPVNALGVTAGVFTGQISLTRALVNGKDTPIQLGFGNTGAADAGTPADLTKLGFRTGAYLSGKVPEDLLVFVTGAGTASSVAASYSGQAVDSKQALRAQPMQLTFDSDTHYTITDINTGTVVAERAFDPTQFKAGVSFQGMQVSFTTPPKAGDGFSLDSNVDGTGNNDNMLALVALESKALIGGKTIGTAYIDQVNDVGNIAQQAKIAQSALTVVHDQAVASRDKVSGVSLDQEAADLIRFQQAYQASAKILQVASTLFDSVLQVR
jgi:hypothetical protein